MEISAAQNPSSRWGAFDKWRPIMRTRKKTTWMHFTKCLFLQSISKYTNIISARFKLLYVRSTEKQIVRLEVVGVSYEGT